MIGLDGLALFHDAFIGIGKGFMEKTLPLAVGKGVIIQKLKLPPEIGDQPGFVMNGQIRITLFGQQTDEFFFKCRFTLETFRA